MNHGIHKIISGGQTGVDLAAWDAARDCGINFGGFVPLGRTNEAGVIDQTYVNIKETQSNNTLERTKRNVEDSDATLVIYRGDGPTGGTAATIQHCLQCSKPWLALEIGKVLDESVVHKAAAWLTSLNPQPRVLNVAGPKLSEDAEIYDLAYDFLQQLLTRRSESRQEKNEFVRHMHADLKADVRHWDQIRWLVPTWHVTLLAAVAVVFGSGQIQDLHYSVFGILAVFGLLCNLLALRTARYHSKQIEGFRQLCKNLQVGQLVEQQLSRNLPFSLEWPQVLTTATFWFQIFILFTTGFCIIQAIFAYLRS